jgi:hypothetical protein
MQGSLGLEIAIPLVLTREGALRRSNRITIYLNPPTGSEKRDYLFSSNRIIKKVFGDGSDLSIGKNYRHLHFDILRSAT